MTWEKIHYTVKAGIELRSAAVVADALPLGQRGGMTAGKSIRLRSVHPKKPNAAFTNC